MKIIKKYLIIIDLLITIIIFGLIYFQKFGHFIPQGVYLALLIIFLSYWITLSIYYNKYLATFYKNKVAFIKATLWSSAITLFLITGTVSLTELILVSRQFLLQITIIPMIVEILLVSLIRKTLLSKNAVMEYEESVIDTQTITDTNAKWVIIGASSLVIIYFMMIFIKTGEFYLYPWSERILLILFASWLFSLLLTKKYSRINTDIVFYQINPFIKSGIVMLILATMLYFFFRIEFLSRYLLFSTIIIYTILETLSFFIYFISNKIDNNSISDSLLSKNNNTWNIENFDFDTDSVQYLSDEEISIKSIFNQISSMEDKNQIIDFLENNLKHITINFYSSSIISVTTIENIEILRNNSKNLLINLHKLNDIRHLNQYLITSHLKLITDGILVGYLLPIDTTYSRLRNQMPKLIFTLFYPFHFIFSRIIPKLPKINRLYFFITQGKSRSISQAEMYGRLNFCGFNIENDIIINGKLFFIAKKVKTVSDITNPSYHPIVKLTRVGYNKELIQIHKFRTMHPYSEFLQKNIFEENELDAKGKFKNDFRITSWGKVMRKFWIDEIPQFYDWIQGRINLVGVRALSEHYFSLYPDELQDLRTKFKPGIIPPYYVDMPNNLDEIFNSERKYLRQKEQNPIKTDIKYAFLALINIIFKGARSK